MKNRFCSVLFFLTLVVSSANAQTLEERVTSIINQMTLEEKILQLHKEGGFNTATNARLGIPGFNMADGPHGVRDGMATAFPVGISMAATWDPEMIYKVGKAMGREFKGKGYHQALGPCIDLTRDPRNGRSPESGGEDPYLDAQITSHLIKGIQDVGVIATAKHYNGVNKQENRLNNNDIISERNLMEHYGLNFRTAVQEGGVLSVMNAYNLINGEKCAENHHTLTDILRTYWGFPFYVVSDWGSIWSSEKAIKAGCNICMGSDDYENDLLNLVNTGAVSIDVINDAVKKVLRTKILTGLLDYYPPGNPGDVNSRENQQVSLDAARKSIVLLKNENNILPLNKNTITKIAIIGPSADVAQLDGSGSSYVTPFYSISPRQGLINKLGLDKVLYTKGCDINSSSTAGFQQALDIAFQSEYVVFVGGLDASQEGEGFDRVGASTVLPGNQQDLINQLAAVNDNLIVILESGGICSINNCIDNIPGLIYAFYPGQEGGTALADVLFGDVNPGGKLPVTMPKTDNQLPAWNSNFNDDFGCGYRWYDAVNRVPQFAFGYGLSYTQFQLSNLIVTPATCQAGEKITASVDVKNIGTREGEEVVQIYISAISHNFLMLVKQLKAFNRISLQPGETKTVSFDLTPESFYYYNEGVGSYKVDAGEYKIMAGNSSDNLTLTQTINLLSSETKPDLRITQIKQFPPYPLKNDKVVFLALIKNEGTAPSPAGAVHKVDFTINGATVSSSVEFDESIPVGAARLVCANANGSTGNWWTAPEVGDYTIEAVVDPENTINEWREDNNSFAKEFKVYNDPPHNIAQGMNVTVSSVEKPGTEGPKAVDGDHTTRWSSQFSDPQYIIVDLGEIKNFNRIDLYWETAYGKEYKIDISDDGQNWNAIFHITNGDGGIDRIETAASARYVRMYGIQRATEWGYSLYEFEIYDTLATGVNSEIPGVKTGFYLENNFPNPFNPSTTIRYQIPEDGMVTLKVFNILGSEVKTLVNEVKTKGRYEIVFDASQLASGLYIYEITSGSYKASKKMTVIK